MSVYQCFNCGCAENTALGWFHSRFSKRIAPTDILGQALCSACAPLNYKSGEPIKKFNGEWHGQFERTFLPRGEFKTNSHGNIEHIETGIIGDEAYKVYGSDRIQ